jgi:hypothetical protein
MQRNIKLVLSLSTIYFIGLVAGMLHPNNGSFAWEWTLITGVSVGITVVLIVNKFFEELDNG